MDNDEEQDELNRKLRKPKLSREEIEAMLQVHDIRQTRVYQEAMEEKRQRGLEDKLRAVSKLVTRNMTAAEIADILELDVDFVRQQLAQERDNKEAKA